MYVLSIVPIEAQRVQDRLWTLSPRFLFLHLSDDVNQGNAFRVGF